MIGPQCLKAFAKASGDHRTGLKSSISGPFLIGNLVGIGCSLTVVGLRLGTLPRTLTSLGRNCSQKAEHIGGERRSKSSTVVTCMASSASLSEHVLGDGRQCVPRPMQREQGGSLIWSSSKIHAATNPARLSVSFRVLLGDSIESAARTASKTVGAG